MKSSMDDEARQKAPITTGILTQTGFEVPKIERIAPVSPVIVFRVKYSQILHERMGPCMDKIKKKVAYFGPGWCIPGHKYGPRIQESTQYICIDTPKLNLWTATGQGIYDRLPPSMKDRVQFKRVCGRNTGLNESSMDEAHVHNVLGDKRIYKSEEIFFEALRIVKGDLYVGETLTPYPLKGILEIGRQRNLSCEIIINGQESGISEPQKEIFYNTIGEFYRHSEDYAYDPISQDSYLVKFRKVSLPTSKCTPQ